MQTFNSVQLEKLWTKIKEDALPLFEDQMQVYELFLKNSRASLVANQVLYVTVESPLGKELLNNESTVRLRPLLNRQTDGALGLQFILSSEEKIIKTPSGASFVASPGRLSGVNRELVFDNLVEGEFNRQAIRAGLQSVEEPAVRWNPLFVYGDAGVGKSHLLNAISNKYHAFYPNQGIKLVDAQEFTREIYESLKSGGEEIERLKRSYEELGILLVDDVQMLAGREKTNEILFHVLNSFINRKKPIILACDKNPEALKGFENRMLSRFKAGLQVQIASPDEQSVRKIVELQFRLSPEKAKVTEEALNYLVNRHFEDIRMLQGVVNRLLFFAPKDKDGKLLPIGLNECKEVLEQGQGLVDNRHGGGARKVIEDVCEHYGVSEALVRGDGRQAKIVKARQIAMYIMRSAHSMTFLNIGKEFGGKDHSTVMAACRKVGAELEGDAALREAINKLISKK